MGEGTLATGLNKDACRGTSFPPLPPLHRPRKPSSVALLACPLAPPLAPLPYHPSPRIPLTTLGCTISPKIAHFKAILELAWTHMGPRWLRSPERHAPSTLAAPPIT